MSFLALKRSFIVLFLFAFFGAGALLINYLIFPAASLFLPKKSHKSFYCGVVHKTWRFFNGMMQKTGIIKVDFVNSERLFDAKRKIIVANHPSFIDIVLLIGFLPDTICVAKKELKKNLFMGNIVKSLYLINDEDNEQLLADTVRVLENGYNIIIFPSGTRTVEGEDLKLHKGAALMALHSGADILPLNIHCDRKFLAKHQKIIDAGEKTINYTITANEPIRTNELLNSADDLTKIQLRNRLNNVIKEKISQA